MKEFITKTVNLSDGNPDTKRAEILEYFRKTWAVDEKLYTQLQSDEVFYHRGDSLRHVLLFYLGHTAVFFINKLFLAKIIDARINPSLESIFAIGVDEMSWDDLDEKHYNWPQVSDVRAYRNKAKELIENVINSVEIKLPVSWNDPLWIIMMGIEHERIHLETSSVLIRQLPINEVVTGKFGKRCPVQGIAPQNEFINVAGGVMNLGKPLNSPYYGWDNEYGNHSETVSDFKASKFLVSNGEFLDFINAGGYETETYWTEEGWSWRNFKQAEMPLFWLKTLDGYKLRLVSEVIPMPWNWPVEVNYLEAKAFCNWKTQVENIIYRLPTEAEWYRLLEVSAVVEMSGNLNLEHYTSPCPVDMFKMGNFYDLTGNVWQWTETPITGFTGFRVHPMYDDFSTPTFDGKHNLIKGGSWISTGNEIDTYSRYAFRRHFYQHAGFRIVQSDIMPEQNTDEYETDVEVAKSCENNWGDAFGNNVDYYKNLAQIVRDTCDITGKKILDLNADTGRLAFELASFCKHITAIDFTARYIRIPLQLLEKGFVRYIVKDENELVYYRELVLSDLNLTVEPSKILFMQDNANNLKPIYSGFDVVILPNLLEELICPIVFLKHIHERITPGGYLLIASVYDWETTEIQRPHWPGGFKKDGEPLTSIEGISEILKTNFNEISERRNLKRIQRISSRRSLVDEVEITVWQRI